MHRPAGEKLQYLIRRMKERITNKDDMSLSSLLSPEFLGCDEDKMTTVLKYRKYDWECNARGELHGGAISAMFDTAMGWTALSYSNNPCISEVQVATADMNVSFIRPFWGESFIFRSEILHKGKTMIRLRSVAYDEETGKTLASSSGSFVYIDR